MQPPRALWVSFPLGRPLGIPGDAKFQHEVVSAALGLLDNPGGPVLADFPKDVPPQKSELLAACPVAFPKRVEPDSSWSNRLLTETELLKPWYELSLRRRNGRTLVGVAEQGPEESIEKLGQLVDADELPTDIKWLKRTVEDLKAYYHEAMTAQPGDYDPVTQQNMFWRDTTLAAAILVLFEKFQNSDSDELKLVARMLAPRQAVGAATGPAGG